MKVIPKGQVVTAKTHLIYGESQVGKTTLIGKLARDLHKRTGQSTRLIMSDQGGFSAIKPGIDEGIIQVVDMVGDTLPQSNLMWLAKGYMPGAEGVINTAAQDLDGIGMVVLDSLSSAAASVLDYFAATGMKVSQEVVGLRQEQGLNFGNPAQSHYGAVQNFMLQLITQFAALPVKRVVFTALESKGSDTVDGQLVLGPLVAGKALTGVIPSRINRIFHLELAAGADKSKRAYRIYFRPHLDPMLGKYWPANLRLPLEMIAAMDGSPKYGKGYLDFTTGEELLELLDYCDSYTAPKPEVMELMASLGSNPAAPSAATPAPKSVTNSATRGPIVVSNRK